MQLNWTLLAKKNVLFIFSPFKTTFFYNLFKTKKSQFILWFSVELSRLALSCLKHNWSRTKFKNSFGVGIDIGVCNFRTLPLFLLFSKSRLTFPALWNPELVIFFKSPNDLGITRNLVTLSSQVITYQKKDKEREQKDRKLENKIVEDNDNELI